MRVIFLFIGNDFPPIVYDKLKNEYGNSLEIVGMTGNRNLNFVLEGRKVPYIRLDQLMFKKYDMLLVVGAQAKMGVLLQNMRYIKAKISFEKVVLDRTFLMPGFSLEKYNELRKKRVTIFSLTCFGGLLSNRLGMEFNSPMVNMFFSSDDFFKLVNSPKEYFGKKLELYGTAWEQNLKWEYPVFLLGDIKVNMNHYGGMSYEQAISIWEERVKRINWDDILVTMCTEDEAVLQEFEKLPYKKKACFVPFETDSNSGYYVPNSAAKGNFWEYFNALADGRLNYYDLWELLLYGNKKWIG